MKIEKISDNQIRCTLTSADLADRKLKLSELAYGTDKAKALFHDMMKRASIEFGFEADNIPLMIEAIPSTSGSVILIITKVDDPEELDTRFSNFSPSKEDKVSTLDIEKLEGSDSILELLEKMKNSMIDNLTETDNDEVEEVIDTTLPQVRLFYFNNLDDMFYISNEVLPTFMGPNTLYQDSKDNLYTLALSQADNSTQEFNRICNILSEYGSVEKVTSTKLAYLEEHCDIIIANEALQSLRSV